ncbi:MAG TPA: DUF1080 domain-containing protein [Opitutaceae bacterium]|nr:DUF1080 domain-containing protein [Opitutaceae bacterium]
MRLILALLSLVVSLHAADDAGFRSLFNGKDLAGWDGLPSFWSVRDGAITGQTTTANPLKTNTFLIWKGGDVGNFELHASFRLTGQNTQGFANSGIQYRSRIFEAAGFVVGGYQMDMDLSGKYVGMLYEERGRGILMQPGQTIRIGQIADGQKKAPVEIVTSTPPAEMLASYRVGEWNDLVIIARGNHLQHFVNGKLTADVTDNDPAKFAATGVLALQLHAGTPMTIQFKALQLKTLP